LCTASHWRRPRTPMRGSQQVEVGSPLESEVGALRRPLLPYTHGSTPERTLAEGPCAAAVAFIVLGSAAQVVEDLLPLFTMSSIQR
jgi:hypothetical protein